MIEESRTNKSVKNIYYGLSYQVIVLVLSFLSRTIFINILGAEYLGINGLYSNILQVLSLADLGMGSAMTFSLYKPLSDNNRLLIASLMNFYKKVYNYIALFVVFFGLALVPFLDTFVNTNTNFPNKELYYILFLSNSVLSYLFISNSTIIIADQKNYLIKKYSLIFEVSKFIIQVIILIFIKNYTLYLLVQVFATFTKNMYIARKSKQMYPYITDNNASLNELEKKNIFDNVKSMFVYKIGGVILNNTDNILISFMIGTIYVGLYSNYLLIVNGIKGFTDILFTSMTASVGNLNAETEINPLKKVEKNTEKVYEGINFLAFWIYGFCSIALFILLNDFIALWIGKEYVFSNNAVLIIVLNFYLPGSLSATILFRDTTGLFKQTKYVFIITSIINLLLSLIFGVYFGLIGILSATLISRLLTNFWFEPYMLYRHFFKKSALKYYLKQARYFIMLLLITIVIISINSYLNLSGIYGFIIKIVFCIAIPNIVIMVSFKNTDEYILIKNKIENIITKKRKFK